MQANGIDASKVTIENVSFPVREPMLAAGQVDAITGFSFSSFINLKDKGVPVDDIVVLLMADYGVNLYGNAIIVNPKFAAEHPDAVKGFLRAFVKGLKETVKKPATAVDSVLKRNEVAKKDVELERLNMAIRDNIVTPEVKANGYGGIDSDALCPRHRSDRPDLQVQGWQAEAGRHLRRLVSAARRRPQIQLVERRRPPGRNAEARRPNWWRESG